MSNPLPPTEDGDALGELDLAACVKVLRALADRPALCASGDPRLAEVRHAAGRLVRALKDLEKQEGAPP